MRSTPIATTALLLCTLVAAPVAAGVILDFDFEAGEGSQVKDKSGQKHHGTVTGASWGDHEAGKALTFKGPDYEAPAKPPGTFVVVDNSGEFNPAKTVTVSASVYPTFNPVAWGGIVEKGTGYGASFRLVMLRDGKVRAAIGNEHLTIDSPEPIPLNSWSKLEMAFDGSKLKLSIDGKVVAEDGASPERLTSSNPIEIGRRFTGMIDDVKVSY